MDGLGLYVRSSLLIDKTMLGQALLHCFSKTKDDRVAMPEIWVSKLNSLTGLGLMWGRHTQRPCLKWQNHLAKPWKYLEVAWKNLNFAVKKDVWCSIVQRPFFNIKNQFVITTVPRTWVQVLDKSPIMTPIQNTWIVNSGN